MKIYLSTTDDLDAALKDNRRPGTEFVLQAGLHWTRGAWWHRDNWASVLAPGCVVRPNDGPWEIRLHPDAPRSIDGNPRPQKDVWAMTHGAGCGWFGGCINGNEQALPDVFVKAALRGEHCTLEEMTFDGCRGDYARHIEAFPLSLIGPGASRLDKITLRSKAPNAYVSAVNFGHVGGSGTTEATDIDIDIGDGNWFAFGVNERVSIVNAKVKGCLRNLVYNDTNRTDGVQIESVRIENGVQRVLSLVVQPSDITAKGNVVLRGIHGGVLADGNGDARFIEVWDQTGGANTGSVLACDCNIESKAERFWAVSGVTGSSAPLLVANSVLPKGARINGKGAILNCKEQP